jgi:hypothetical protein
MNFINRIKAPTPGLFKKIRNAGLAIAAISGVMLHSPVPLPQQLIKVAGYMAVAGGVASAICQVTTGEDDSTNTNEPTAEPNNIRHTYRHCPGFTNANNKCRNCKNHNNGSHRRSSKFLSVLYHKSFPEMD